MLTFSRVRPHTVLRSTGAWCFFVVGLVGRMGLDEIDVPPF